MKVLGEEADVIAPGQQLLKEFARFLVTPGGRQRIDVPEGTDREGYLGNTKIISRVVTQQVALLEEKALDGGDGSKITRIHGVDEAHLLHQQQAGIQMLTFKGRSEERRVG